jgi:hypothetical protein
MKIRTFVFTAATAVFAGLLAFSGSALALRPGCDAPPCGGSSDDGGAPDLGDLIVLYRDAWGLPYLVGDSCQQPIPADPLPDTCPESCVVDGFPSGVSVVSVDENSCAVTPGCEACTQEVDFGRTSVIRSPVSVIEQSLGEVVTKLATAQCTSLDPAGRLVNTSEIDDLVLSATIDSPLENLAIYRQLMLTGYLGADATAIVLPDPNVLNMAARGFGAGADKTGKVTVDQLVYSNEIMGLTDESVPTYLPKICMNVREEVQGTVQPVRKCFLNYGGEHPVYESIGGTIANYQYDRAVNFLALPAPPYIDEYAVDGETIIQEDVPGWFEYLGVYDDTVFPKLFYIVQGPILDNVFGEGFQGGNVGGFAQAADDTREVIEFTHDRPLPLGYETAVPLCDVPDTDLIYDVFISEESGLQVPVQMVDGSEGRVFTVSVGNVGPDDASGIVTVTAVEANGNPIADSPWTFNFGDGVDAICPDPIAADESCSWTTTFAIDLGHATTISWTATAVPDCATCDLNTVNNTVTAATSVRMTGGGGGQGGRP